jgi:SAM-dependent methyltransferase
VSATITPTCPACGGITRPSAWLAPLPFNTCASCGFSFRTDLDAAGTHDIYRGGGYESARADEYATDAGSDERRRHARVRVEFLTRHAKGGRVLDVGAAGGAFVLEAGAAGWAAQGIEPAPSFARYAREVLGVDVATSTLEEAELPDAAFDVVTMWHVLEHLPDVRAALALVSEVLRPGGRLALEVPNAGSTVARVMRRDWPMLEPAVHVNQFTPLALRRLLEGAALRVDHLSTVSAGAYDPLRARLGPRHLAHLLRFGGRGRLRRELLRAVATRP